MQLLTRQAKDKIKECETASSVVLSALIWNLQLLGINIDNVQRKFKKQICELMNKKRYKRIKECNHRMDW